MKKALFIFAAVLMMGISAQKSYAQLTDEEYNYVTMDLRGILNLTMTTNAQVDFTFKTIQEYNHGITQFNATQLEVDATLAWDLFVFPSTDTWTQVESYSTNGNPTLPTQILEMQSNVACVAPENMANAWKPLMDNTNGGGGVASAAIQYLAGEFGTAAGESNAPGTAAKNPDTHKFRIDMRLVPGIPAEFSNSALGTNAVTIAAGGNNIAFAQAGYYYLEVVYSLVEDM